MDPLTGTVLVVDDEPDMLHMLSFMLQLEGFEVLSATSGAEAIELLGRAACDVALTDLRMPRMNGILTLQALKALAPTLEVIIATGYSSEETRRDCFAAGAFSVLAKPFDAAELVTQLRAAIRKRREREHALGDSV